ncbi:MAG TPA: hypothetical protein VM260_19800 [Pirellula sp.]|nr:hypothetical protein [Pirellula sp.]
MNLPDMDSVDEQLTAYLDGELPPIEATAIERSIVDDERLRLRLAELRQAYDLLDEIPETPHNQKFTKSTMELVIKDLSTTAPFTASSDVGVKSKYRDWWAWPRVMVLIAVFAVAGSLAAIVVSFVNTRRELRDLGLFAGIRGLEDVNEVNIAIKLSQETVALAVLKDGLGDRLVPPPPDSLWQRKTWVQSLTPIQVSRLENGRERIGRLDPATVKRLAAMESEIESLPEHKMIQETVHLLGLVMDGIGNSRRLDMAAMKPEQRYAFLKEELYFKAANLYATRMTTSDREALTEWDQNFFHPALFQELQRPWDTGLLLGLLSVLRGRDDLELDGQEELIGELATGLSPTAKKMIESLSKKNQIYVLSRWLFPISPTNALLDSYDKLDDDERDKQDLADPQEVKRMLQRRIRGAMRGPRS